MTNNGAGDFFERARTIAVAFMLLAGTLGMVGTLLDWIQLRERVTPLPGAEFLVPINEDVGQTEPFAGVEVNDGRIVLGAAAVLLAAALSILLRGSGAGLAIVASLVIGAVTISDYRGIGDPASEFSLRTDIGLEAQPGIGLIICASAGLLGLLASVAAMAATPRHDVDGAA